MKSPLRLALLALGLLVFLGGPSLLRYYTDWLWFGEVGYRQVFLTMIRSQGTLFTLSFVVATVWLVANLNVALNAIGNVRPVFTTREGIQVTLPGGQQLRTLARGVAHSRRGDHWPLCLRPVAGMADVAVRLAVRRRRSDPRPRRLLLRLLPSLPATDPSSFADDGRTGGADLGRDLPGVRTSDVRLPCHGFRCRPSRAGISCSSLRRFFSCWHGARG